MMTGSSTNKSINMPIFFRHILVAVIAFSCTVFGHSWNEQLSLIGPGGTYIGNGYSRGYVARTDPGFNGESMKYLLPPLASGRTRIDGSDLLCHPAQRTQNQPAKYPRLQVAPGSAVAMKYLENGHVSLPNNQKGKPPKGGTVFVFGTSQPKPDEKITEVLKWTKDGSGGDKRGILIGANNYDDDRCHQINGGPISIQRQQEFPDPVPGQPGTHSELWCETDIILPKNIPVGKLYTIYWVWQWPTAKGQDPGLPDGKDEYYTTCSDFDVLAQAPPGPVKNVLPQQDPNMEAPADYLNRPAITPVPILGQPTTPAPAAGPPVAHAPPPAAHAPPPATGHQLNLENNGAVAFAAPPVHEGKAMTAVITVTAHMPPGQTKMVVEGKHVITFTAQATPAPTIAPRGIRPGKWRIEGIETHEDDGPFPGIE